MRSAAWRWGGRTTSSPDAGGGDRAAAMYSIVQTAKMNDLNSEAYLCDTLTRIAERHQISRIEELMPWKGK